ETRVFCRGRTPCRPANVSGVQLRLRRRATLAERHRGRSLQMPGLCLTSVLSSNPMLLGYNTNGLAFHRWDDALRLLADVGYESVAVTLDHHCLDPFSEDLPGEV